MYLPTVEETATQRRQRKTAAKIALANRRQEEAMGLCRCSTEEGVFLRHLSEGCPGTQHLKEVEDG